MNNRHVILMMAVLAVLVASVCDSARAQFLTRSGTKLTSETIPAIGIETEVADDFVLPVASTVTQIAIVGGPYALTGPSSWTFGIKFYSDASCTPDILLMEFVDSNITGGPPVPDTDGFPISSYLLPVAFSGAGNTTYWFSVQALDHVFPPQWGVKLTTPNLCPAMFRSTFLGYLNWTVESLVPEEHSIDAQIVYQGPDAVYPTTWGRIKGLYR